MQEPDTRTPVQVIKEERQALYRALLAGEEVQYTPKAVLDLLVTAEMALTEQAGQISAYKGMIAAMQGKETILTFDRIGTEGVPTNHPDGTILACTDSDRKWVLKGGEWVLDA